nr:acetyltransferase [Thiopseudomonas alkaliphila]
MSKFTGTPKLTLAILGASGHGKVVAETAELLGYQCVFFDDAYPSVKNNEDWPVIGITDNLLEQAANFAAVTVAIGNNAIRLAKIQQLQDAGAKLVTLVHPRAIVSSYANLQPASVVFAGAVINPFAQIGRGCIINTAASIDHDCVIADGVHISPGTHLAGNVSVGKEAWVGIGAAVKQGINIAANCTVGAGAVVVKDVAGSMTVVGNPAKPLFKS